MTIKFDYKKQNLFYISKYILYILIKFIITYSYDPYLITLKIPSQMSNLSLIIPSILSNERKKKDEISNIFHLLLQILLKNNDGKRKR